MRLLPLPLMVLVACGPRGEPATQTTPSTDETPRPDLTSPTGTVDPGDPTDPAEPAGEAVELHEWGLVDVGGAGQATLGAGPINPPPPMVARKPVIYAHLLRGDSASLSVRARFPAGTALEHWPAAEVSPGAIGWNGIEVRRGPCATVHRDVRDLPSECNAPDGVCELAELATYATTDHDCMRAGDIEAGLLFYRAALPRAALPVRVERAGDAGVAITATQPLTGAPRALLRISTARSGRGLVIARTELPRAGVTTVLVLGTDALDPQAERASLGRDLRAFGLTDDEARAFLDAWSGELLGVAPERGPARRAARAIRRDFLVYWLPPLAVSSIATLETDPPAVVRRAFMVRIDLTTLR